MEVVDLNDQGAQPVGAALRVPFPASEVRNLSACDGNAFPIRRGNPAAPLEGEEELPETSDMRSDLATGADLNDMDVCFPGPGGQLRRTGIPALKIDDWRERARRRTEDNHSLVLTRWWAA